MRKERNADNLDLPFIRKFCTSLNIFTILIISLYTLRTWTLLPDQVATHFDITGSPDAYGNRITVLLMIGAILLMFGLIHLSSRFPKFISYPVKITQDNLEKQEQLAMDFLQIIGLQVTLLMTYIQWSIIQGALSNEPKLNSLVMMSLIGIMFISSGIYFFQALKSK